MYDKPQTPLVTNTVTPITPVIDPIVENVPKNEEPVVENSNTMDAWFKRMFKL